MPGEPLPLGTLPPVGEIPDTMHAQVIRSERMGRPDTAFRPEVVDVPRPGHGEVLVAVMAAGINFNNVWAARGLPVDVIALRRRAGASEDFHIGGSDASGIVYQVGPGVDDVRVGDEVVIHPGWWEADDRWIADGGDPMVAPSARIWGYDTNFGSFAQFCIAQSHQCLPKPATLSWAEAAASTLVGTTAYRMLFGWPGNVVEPGDVVLVWGGSGGLGAQAIQLVRHAGGVAVAVVSDDERGKFCVDRGAVGYVDRTGFDHWGIPPHWTDADGQRAWQRGVRAFGNAVSDRVGSRVSPKIVFEHPGEATVPTSVYLCAPGGMVVICAGTTGYSATVDLRYHWTRQKRLQGSHGTNDAQAHAYNKLLATGAISPSLGEVATFADIPQIHQRMLEGRLAPGNTAIRIGAGAD